MDQHGQVDVADAATGAGNAMYPPGASVYDAEGEKLGTVSDRQDKEDFLVVHKGWLFGHDASIPRAAIARSDANGVHLRVRKDDLKTMNQTPMPEPTAPIRPMAGAPDAAAADQPPILPVTPGFPGPEVNMGAAVAAMDVPDDAAREPAPACGSPVRSAIGAAQDAAGQAVEAVREQVGPLVDTMREQVGPLAEQVKEQASAVAQQQMTSVADGLERAAGLVNTVGDQLRENNLGDLSRYTDLTADEMKKAAAWLRTTKPEEIAQNVEDLAKKQPELFIAGVLALGLLGLRLLRGASQGGDEKKDENQ